MKWKTTLQNQTPELGELIWIWIKGFGAAPAIYYPTRNRALHRFKVVDGLERDNRYFGHMLWQSVKTPEPPPVEKPK